MTNQQGAPEALRPEMLDDLIETFATAGLGRHNLMRVELPRHQWAQLAVALSRLHAENERLAALVEAQQPAPSAAAEPVAVKAMGYGGSTGINDYLMSDGTMKAMRPSEVKWAPQPSPTPQADPLQPIVALQESAGMYADDFTPQADSAQDEPLQAFDSPRAKALMRAWEEGWAACRDAEYVGKETQNDAFNSSHTLTLCIAEDQQLPAPQADSQPAQVEASDAMADSQYLAGVSAGWNAANADDPNEALRKLHKSRAGYLKPIRAARAPAPSVLEDAARLERERICAAIKAEDDYCVDHGDYMLDSDDCIKIVRGEWVRPDFSVGAARKQGANHD